MFGRIARPVASSLPAVIVWLAAAPLARTAVSQQPAAATRDTAPPSGLVPVRVTGRRDDLTGIATSASEGRVGARDLRLRPLLREGELLEVVPGMIVTQHSGDGKANQYFVRGFNLDHGTDFSTRVDGVPINSPTHAHGHGYTDLNFLIPELVDHIDYRLGVSHASLGDFGSAGGAELRLVRRLEQPLAVAEAGAWGFGRLVLGASPEVAKGRLLLAVEGRTYDGPWVLPQQLRKRSGVVRWSRETDRTLVSVTAMSYANNWRASDQIPLRLVEAGTLGRFGQVDSTLGGASERHALSAQWQHRRGVVAMGGTAYAVRSALDLYSNFTYRLDDPTDGDQFNQRDRRTTIGGDLWIRRVLATRHTWSGGAQARRDAIDGIGLFRTVRRERLSTVRQDDVVQGSLGLWTDVESRWTPWLRTTLGLRSDGYQFDVTAGEAANSGRRAAWITSPKAAIAIAPTDGVELYVSGGTGFHSNDARGATITVVPGSTTPAERVSPLVRSRGGEVGLRFARGGWRVTAAAWQLGLDSELLFIGDGGTTEAVDGSRRRGVTVAAFWRPDDTWTFDVDGSLARARFRGVAADASYIPGALEDVLAAGVTWGGNRAGPFAAARLRHFGAYPLIEDNSVRATPTSLVNLNLGWQFERVRVQAALLNVGNGAARDIQYFYASRLTGEPAAGVDDVHFHPVEPRQVRVSVRWGL